MVSLKQLHQEEKSIWKITCKSFIHKAGTIINIGMAGGDVDALKKEDNT